MMLLSGFTLVAVKVLFVFHVSFNIVMLAVANPLFSIFRKKLPLHGRLHEQADYRELFPIYQDLDFHIIPCK